MKITFVTGIQKGEEKPLEFTSYGAITEEGERAYFSGVREYEIERIAQKEIEDIENDFDPIEAPPGPYTIKPDKQGRTNVANEKQQLDIKESYLKENLFGSLEPQGWVNPRQPSTWPRIMALFTTRGTPSVRCGTHSTTWSQTTPLWRPALRDCSEVTCL